VIGKNLFLLDLCLVEQLWLKGTLHTYELGLTRQNHQNIVGGVDAKVALYSSSCHYVFLEFTRDRYEAAFFPLLIGYVTRHAPGPSASIMNCNTLCLRFKELLSSRFYHLPTPIITLTTLAAILYHPRFGKYDSFVMLPILALSSPIGEIPATLMIDVPDDYWNRIRNYSLWGVSSRSHRLYRRWRQHRPAFPGTLHGSTTSLCYPGTTIHASCSRCDSCQLDDS
jgi:hypothetical protein